MTPPPKTYNCVRKSADPFNSALKLAADKAKAALKAAAAKKQASDATWATKTTEWKKKLEEWRLKKMPQTPQACGTVLAEKGTIDIPIRKAHHDWVKAWRTYRQAKVDDRKHHDAASQKRLEDAMANFERASNDLDNSVSSWDSGTQMWCDKGMYCSPVSTDPISALPINPGGPMIPAPGYPVAPIDASTSQAPINQPPIVAV